MSTSTVLARNPLVAELREQDRTTYQSAVATSGSPPTLFATGDLPLYTASGNPPSALLNLPWQLRHAAAKADGAEWARLLNEYGSFEPGMEALLAYEPAAQDPANDDYRNRVKAWRESSWRGRS